MLSSLYLKLREKLHREVVPEEEDGEKGQGMVEYALILVLIAVVVIVILSIVVEEELDAEVIIKVNQTSVYRAIPPWIGQRLLQRPIRPEVDAHRRKEFHDKIIGYVSRGIARERELRNRFEHA